MTPRKISIHQIGHGLPVRDGAADAMAVIKHALVQLGFASEIFVDRIEGIWPSPVRPLSELRPDPQDLVLLHYWTYQERLDWLAGLRCRKALVFHGITPPWYFAPDSRDYQRSVKAHGQLASLRRISEAAVTPSRATAEELQRRGFSPVATIRLARDRSDLRLLDPVDPDNADGRAVCRLVNIGTIAEFNRQREAVGVVGAIGAIGSVPLALTLIGSGEPDRRYRAAVKDDIDRLGLGDRVAVIDSVSPNALAGHCRAACAYLSLSDSEESIAAVRAAMALDLPVVAFAAPGMQDLLGGAGILIDSSDPAAIDDAVYRLQQHGSWRRALIRRQREEACSDRTDLVRRDLQQWLLDIGAYETRPLVARLIGRRAGATARHHEPVASAAVGPARQAVIHYAIEAPLQPGGELGDADRLIALALNRLPGRTVSVHLTGEGARSFSPAEPVLQRLIRPTAALAERIVTIRRSHPTDPGRLLGDVRLMHLDEADGRIEPPLAGLINLHLDGVLVASQSARRAVRDSGVRLPVAAIGHGVDDRPADPPDHHALSDNAGLRWPRIAETIDEFVLSLDKKSAMNRKIRLAWVSTFNSRCGLATHSEHLLEHFDRDVYDITVIGNHQEPLKPDPANVVRLWPDRTGSLASVRDFIRDFDVVFVNFHFSLIEIYDLAATLRAAQDAGIDTHVTLHKTADTMINGRVVSLGAIAEVLRACTKLIVHTEADIARLDEFGVIDNVVMIPPGVIERRALSPSTVRSLLDLQQSQQILGTFGFLLPPKGLQRLIHAFALVLRHFPDAMLLMLNAEYLEDPDSADERDRSLALIRELELDERIRLVDQFLETDEILLLLNACDLTVFTYQDSAESDSGAVRLGLAAGRPVATTPLPVFANLAGVVHQFSGSAVADIADGIVALLRDPERAAAIRQRQQEWIGRNSWAAQAARIGNIIRGCFEETHGVELLLPPPARILPVLPAPTPNGEAGNATALREMLGLLQPADPTGQPPLPAAPPETAPAAMDWPVRQAR